MPLMKSVICLPRAFWKDLAAQGAAHRCLWAGTQPLSPSQFASGALASQLALLLLERSDSLFQVEGYEADVHRWVSPGGSTGLLHPSCGSSPPVPSALVTADPLPSLTPRPSLGTSWAAAQTLPTPESCHIPSPPASLGQSLPEDALSESPTHEGSSPRQPSQRTEPTPLDGSSPDGPWGWGLLRGVLSDRVLSSQFPALCKLHPPLVVERAKELLEFVGSLGGPRSTGHVLTSVVRRPPPRPGLRLARGLLWAECCSLPRCGPLASTSRCPGTGAAVRSRSAGSLKLWRPCSSRSPSLGPPPPFPSVLRRSSLCS